MEEQNLTFHVPGHQHSLGAPPEFKNLIHHWGLACDITEVLGIDDIHAPHRQCLEAQRLAALCYGADHSYFLINGSTVGNQAMFLATLGPQDTVLMPQNSHRSAYAALLLCGAKAHAFPTSFDEDLLCCKPPSLKEFLHGLEQCPEAKALFLTSPTYHGDCAPIHSIVEEAHRGGLMVFVDEAWGSHLAFHPELPNSAVSAGADLVVQSTHKLSAGLTQGAMLHLRGSAVDQQRLETVLRHLQSSSPSSLLVASLDCARRQMAIEGEKLLSNVLQLSRLAAKKINQIPGLKCYVGGELWDPCRLLVRATERGYSGPELAIYLRRNHQIQAEMWELHQVLFLVTLGHTEDHVEGLLQALRTLPPKALGFEFGEIQTTYASLYREMSLAEPPHLSLRETFFSPSRRVAIEKAVDQTSAELLYCYPPGVPLVYPGQRFSKAITEHIKTQRRFGGCVLGGTDPTGETVMIVEDNDDRKQ